MPRYTLLLIFQFIVSTVFAQSGRYGNEWIQHDQTYYRIPIARPGLYRLTTDDLRRAGVPVSTVDPTTLQVFRRGIEQAITVAGEADKRLDAADYLEFFGQANDGRQDSALYRPASAQPHSFYSMYSDTAAYFLTWRTGQAGKRMTVVGETSGTGLSAEPYVLADQQLLLTQEYTFQQFAPSPTRDEVFFEEGEGWTGPIQQRETPYVQTIKLENWQRSASVPVSVEVLLNGRDNAQHVVDLFVGASRRLLGTAQFDLFRTTRLKSTIDAGDVNAAGELILTTLARGTGPSDRYSVSLIQVRYPQEPSLTGLTQRSFRLRPNSQGRSLLELTNVPQNVVLLDITDSGSPRRLAGQREGTTLRLVVDKTTTERELLALTAPVTPTRLERVSFRRLDPAKANYLIVTHELLTKPAGTVADPVRAFAAYRASAQGGRYDTLIVTTKELYNQFSYGERTPLAIRRFADWMFSAGQKDKFLLLMGRANSNYPARKNPNQYIIDIVPTIGYQPASDILFTEGLAGFPANVPAMPTGRINTLMPQEVLNYLNKVKEFESLPLSAPWRKDILHLSGGRSQFELTTFRDMLSMVGQTAQSQFLGAEVIARTKKTDEPVERIDVADVVNSGVSLITFFGHSSPTVTDVDFGRPSNPAHGFRNKGRYSLMFFNGCGVGNVFWGGTNILSTDWMMTPDKGAIAVLAHCYSGFVGPLNNFVQVFYRTLLADSAMMSRPIGLIHRETTRRALVEFKGDFDIANAHQMVLQGDPALRIYPMTRADFVLDPEGVQAESGSRKDSVRLQVVVRNDGRFSQGERVTLAVRRRLPDSGLQRLTTLSNLTIVNRDTLRIAFKPDLATGTRYELVVDGDNRVTELDETNNLLVFDVRDSGADYTIVLPESGQRFPTDRLNPLLEVTFDGRRLTDGALVSPSPLIRVVVTDEDRYRIRQDTVGIDLLLRRPCSGCDFQRVTLAGPQVRWQPADSDNRFVLDYRPQNLPDGLYALQVQATDVSGNRAGPTPYEITFRVKSEDSLSGLRAMPNPFSLQTHFQFTLTGRDSVGTGRILVYNLTGQVVRELSQAVRIGENFVEWDGRDGGGVPLANGLYVYQLVLPDGRKKDGKVVLSR